MTADATLTLQFWVQATDGTSQKATELILNNVALGFIAPITDMSLVIDITKINVASVTVVSCAFGKLSSILIKTEINNGFRVVQPSLNAWLAKKPFQFPKQIFGLFELTSMTLSYYNSYLYVGITPIFIGPPPITSTSFVQL